MGIWGFRYCRQIILRLKYWIFRYVGRSGGLWDVLWLKIGVKWGIMAILWVIFRVLVADCGVWMKQHTGKA